MGKWVRVGKVRGKVEKYGGGGMKGRGGVEVGVDEDGV